MSGRQLAASTAICLRARASSSTPIAVGKGIKAGQVYKPYKLQSSWEITPDSKILRFELPAVGENTATLGVPAPSGVKVKAHTDTEGLVSKSYSPISHPDAVGIFDLLVKQYPAPEGGRQHIVRQKQRIA